MMLLKENNIEYKKIGILYRYYPDWIGGTIYIFNILKALELQAVNKINLPKIILFISRHEKNKLDFNFPNLENEIVFYDLNNIQKIINKICLKIGLKQFFLNKYKEPLDFLFPVFTNWLYFEKTPIENQYYWIPDFQCFHLPHLFTIDDVIKRKEQYDVTIENAKNLVISSNAVKNDLLYLYQKQNYPNLHILRFATFNEYPKQFDLKSIGISKPYFICPNQFWGHKNQIVILNAIKQMGNENLPFQVVFTGKENDPRNPLHFESVIKPEMNNSFVRNNVLFLGFIDRNVQLSLIDQSLALIQPSKFEGWSTVIEDGMFFNKPIIATNLEVNIEQLGSLGYFFEADDCEELLRLILEIFNSDLRSIDYHYENKQLKFGEDLLGFIN
jgi:glycosyltransferase involved in cell wall biosynthesis